MTDAKAFIREWMDATTMGPEENFVGFAAEDIVMRFPYIPAGMSDEIHGLENVLTTFREVWKDFATFEWHDVNISKVEGEDVYVATGRSEATRAGGQPYSNSYVLFTRVRDGKVVEHVEYFNPSGLTA